MRNATNKITMKQEIRPPDGIGCVRTKPIYGAVKAQGVVSEHARVMKDNSHNVSKCDIVWEKFL